VVADTPEAPFILDELSKDLVRESRADLKRRFLGQPGGQTVHKVK
jgi:hypothetical protein